MHGLGAATFAIHSTPQLSDRLIVQIVRQLVQPENKNGIFINIIMNDQIIYYGRFQHLMNNIQHTSARYGTNIALAKLPAIPDPR